MKSVARSLQGTRPTLPLLLLLPLADAPAHSAELAFPLHMKHNHAPGLVELPSGELLMSWHRGSGEASADDVAVLGARKQPGEEWGEPFELADTPGFPNGDTVLFLDPKGKLWLFWPLKGARG